MVNDADVQILVFFRGLVLLDFAPDPGSPELGFGRH